MTKKYTAFILMIFIFFTAFMTYANDKALKIFTNSNFTRKIISANDKLYVATTGGLLIYNIDDMDHPLHLTTLDGLAYNDVPMMSVNDKGNIFIKNPFGFFISYQSYINGSFNPLREGVYDFQIKENTVLDAFIKEEYSNLIPIEEWNADEWIIDPDGHIWYISGVYLKEYQRIGDEVKKYFPPQYRGLPDYAIAFNRILKDDHYIWLSTVGYYIFRFDIDLKDDEDKDKAWTHFQGDDDVMMNIYEATKAPDGSIWFYGYYKIFKYEDNYDGIYDDNDFKSFGEAEGLPAYRSRNLAIDKIAENWGVWVGSYAGLARYKNGKWNRFIQDDTGLTNYYIIDLETDSNGRLWVGTQDGIFVTQDDGKTFTHESSNNSIPNSTVTKVVADQNDIIWGGTYASGIFCINETEEKPVHPFKKSDIPPTIPSNLINDIVVDVVDQNNRIWIGTDDGLALKNESGEWSKFDHEGYWTSSDDGWILKDYINKLPGKNVDVLALDQNNNIYCGISAGDELLGGIVKIEMDTDTVTPYQNVSSSFAMSINALAVDSLNRIWASSYINGLYYCFNDKDPWKFKEFPPPFRTDYINCIVTPKEDSDLWNSEKYKNFVWFGTVFDGIFVLFEEDGIEKWFHLNVDGASIYSDNNWVSVDKSLTLVENNIYSICLHKDYIWIGYSSSGATKYKLGVLPPVNITYEDGLADNTVYSITVDSQDRAWLGTYSGLSVFNED